MTPSVSSERHNGITVVTLNRPDVRNAVDADTARALHAAFLAFDDDPASRVAVFHGANGHFCAGWDLQSGARLHAQGVRGDALTHLQWPADAPDPLGPTRRRGARSRAGDVTCMMPDAPLAQRTPRFTGWSRLPSI